MMLKKKKVLTINDVKQGEKFSLGPQSYTRDSDDWATPIDEDGAKIGPPIIVDLSWHITVPKGA
jgi:hypothetical protein